MPSMKNEPWAKLTMRMTPKISDSPADTRNSDDAEASPLSNWTSRPEKLMRNSPGDAVAGRGQCQSAARNFRTSSAGG